MPGGVRVRRSGKPPSQRRSAVRAPTRRVGGGAASRPVSQHRGRSRLFHFRGSAGV